MVATQARVSFYAHLRTATRMPSFTALKFSRMVSLFGRVSASSSHLLFSMMALSSGSQWDWCVKLLDALAWLRNLSPSLSNTPVPAVDSLSDWANVANVLGGEWKMLIKSALRRSIEVDPLEAAIEAALEAEGQDDAEVATFVCEDCGKTCASRA
eukprot:6093245-Amphidinium_carterae.1